MSVGYLLDTNAISEILRARPSPVLISWITSVPFTEQFLSSITVAELFRGAYRAGASERHIRNIHERVLPNVMVLPFDAATADIYGGLEARHRAAGTRIDDFDLMIAATAIQFGLILVTRNTRHFSRIVELTVMRTPGDIGTLE